MEFICKYCGRSCKSIKSLRTHERLCKLNPNHAETGFTAYNQKEKESGPWNKGLTKEIDERIARQAVKQAISMKGKNRRPHTEAEKQLRRELAYKRKIGGFFMRRGIDYNGIKLDSTYEVEVAKSLDANNIKWERCKRFPYVVEGKLHYYTPDFYLPEYNIYLDPKNDFLLNNVNPKLGYTDKFKIEQVMLQNNIKVIILDKTQLNWESIKQKIV